MMPANAHHMFQVIIQIAHYNIVPLEEAIEDMEAMIGIQNDNFILSDNFADFGYDSSDLIRNL